MYLKIVPGWEDETPQALYVWQDSMVSLCFALSPEGFQTSCPWTTAWWLDSECHESPLSAIVPLVLSQHNLNLYNRCKFQLCESPETQKMLLHCFIILPRHLIVLKMWLVLLIQQFRTFAASLSLQSLPEYMIGRCRIQVCALLPYAVNHFVKVRTAKRGSLPVITGNHSNMVRRFTVVRQ